MLSEEMLARLNRHNPARLVIGYSGGLDSHVLLHVAHTLTIPVHALHVDHGLDSDSGAWAAHAARVCDALGIPFTNLLVAVSTKGSVEENARHARYGAFESFLVPGDLLLLAHHADDQIETALMNLFRGSARPGVGGMPVERAIGRGYLLRPLLDQSRSALQEYARRHGLSWIEDASNQDTGYSRNHIRHELLPMIEKRWPGARGALQGAIRRDEEAMQIIDSIGKSDLDAALDGSPGVSIAALWALPAPRRRNAIRCWLAGFGLPMPAETMLEAGLDSLKDAAADRMPVLAFQGVCLRRHGERIFLTDAVETVSPEPVPRNLDPHIFDHDDEIDLGHGSLFTNLTKGRGIALARIGAVSIRYRQGGERISLGAHRTLKNVLQEAGVPAFLRDLVPLIYLDDELIAIAGLPDWQVPMVVAGSFVAAGADSGVELSFKMPNQPYSH